MPFRLDTEGRSANRHDTLGGMRWTLWRAGDACRLRTVKSCGPVPSTLGVKLRKRFCVATVANKPETPGRARSSRKNHRAGNAGSFRPTCGDYACVPSTPFCTQGCGRGWRPAFPAPSDFLRDTNYASLGRIGAAGMLTLGCLTLQIAGARVPITARPACGERCNDDDGCLHLEQAAAAFRRVLTARLP